MSNRFESLPEELKDILQNRRETLPLALEWLGIHTPKQAYHDSNSQQVLHWETVGLSLLNNARFHETISLFRILYDRMSAAQSVSGQWVHKGMPLVWIRDCHKRLGHRWSAERYLLLTLIEDAIRENGQIRPSGGGIYHRFCWEDGRSHEEFEDLSDLSWQAYQTAGKLGVYPEHILPRLKPEHFRMSATALEADNYEVSKAYAKALLSQTDTASVGQSAWRALEDLAAYLLGCIPGFQIEHRKTTKDYHFDGFIRARGNYQDFRSDLGLYLLIECKNWKDPVGTDTIAYFAQKLAFHDCRAGILFSKMGVTAGQKGKEDRRFGALTVLKSYHHSGRIIMVLDFRDFKRVTQGESLIATLQRKYEEVRFDLP